MPLSVSPNEAALRLKPQEGRLAVRSCCNALQSRENLLAAFTPIEALHIFFPQLGLFIQNYLLQVCVCVCFSFESCFVRLFPHQIS